MTRRIVITGVDGFVGRHLARIAADEGIEVFGVSRSSATDGELDQFLADYVSADLRVGWPQALPLDATVVHLAGLAAVGPSFEAPQEYIASNSAMVTHLCESLLNSNDRRRLICVSTGAVYASGAGESRHDENAKVGFTSPYVVSKMLVENQVAYYRSRGLDAISVRPFNHVGPGQGPGFVVPDIIARLRALPEGGELAVGDLTTRRDYTDVRDVARAYLALADLPRPQHDVYNVASGHARTGEEILRHVCEALGRRLPSTTIDPTRIRPNDPRSIVGDASRLRAETGWAPRYTLTETIHDAVA